MFGGLLLASLVTQAPAQETPCLNQVRAAVRPGVWDTITNYFSDLSFTSEASRNRSRLLQLRAQIIIFESEKQQLIDIVEAHVVNSASGNAVAAQLRFSAIPQILARMESILLELQRIAGAGNLFAAGDSFKALMVNLDGKRASTLCLLDLETRAPSPDASALKRS